MSDNINVPYQIQQIIQGLLNSRDSVHLRGNYRMRLDVIREEINKAILKYDQEVMLKDASSSRRSRSKKTGEINA